MLRRIEVKSYKALKYIDVHLSDFHLLVGPNASGKSTFLDVFALLKDILNEDVEKAIQKRCSRFEELVWLQEKNEIQIGLEIAIPPTVRSFLKDQSYKYARYEMAIGTDSSHGVIITKENLWLKQEEKEKTQRISFPEELDSPPVVAKPSSSKSPRGWKKLISRQADGKDYFRSEITNWNTLYSSGPKKSSLSRVPEDKEKFPVTLWIRNFISQGIQYIYLNSEAMRKPCRPDSPLSFEANGSNLPKVIKVFKEKYPDRYSQWLQHIQTTLSDITDIEVKEKQEDRYLFLNLQYNKVKNIPSWLLSDGTLRLLAQTLLAYLPPEFLSSEANIYMIEEPENGLHPLAIESVFQSLSSVYENQVLLATHSPLLVGLAQPAQILCFSKLESGAIDIIRGDEHPLLKNWKEGIDLATYFAAGVLQ